MLIADFYKLYAVVCCRDFRCNNTMPSTVNNNSNSRKRKIPPSNSGPTNASSDKFKLLAIDCEFVGVGPRKLSALGMVALHLLAFH